MLVNSKALFKLLESDHEWVECNGEHIHVIPEGLFTQEEIEELRDIENLRQKYGYPMTIANFLPDDIRPAHVKKL